ncbi:MAG: TIR domain-containing protein [Snowella sp.]|nr:TIR domain-containing protein [Snowella sp.]
MPETWTYDLFISYAQANRDWVEGYLLDAIEKAEVRYTSESAFTLGVPRILEFERAIRQSRFTLLVISEAYLADDLTRFIDILAQSYGEQVGTWPVIPLILDEGLKLPARLKMLEGLKASSSEQWESVIERLCNQLQRPLPSPSVKPPCPYPGMLPFSEHDEERFFGRDDEIEELLGKLRLNPFLTVIGSSGSGKSSLVFAGLIPRLKQSGLFGAGQWYIRSFRPGTNPLANLEAVLGIDTSALEIQIQQLLSSQFDVRRLLLVVDQFEELFSQKSTNLILFQQTLLKLIEIPNVYLILTVRADFYADLMGSLLWSKIHSHNFNVLPLDEKGLREAIVRPAEGVEVYIDSALVERLLVDAQGEPGVLPLIQETLVLLWEKLERHFLPLKSYELLVLPRPAYGATPTQPRTGLQVAITYRADAALAGLETEEKQAIARRIFLRLIQFGEGRPDTRRQQLEEDLRSFEDNSLQFDDTLEYLASSTRRLLTFSGEEGDQKRKVDIAHEALILGWPTLQQWISELREAEKTRRRLKEKAQEWIRLQKNGGLLDKGELPEAEVWLSSNEAKVLGYDKSLYDLITASRETLEKIKREKEEQQQRELQLIQERLDEEKKARRAAQKVSILSFVALFTVLFAGGFAWWKQEQTKQAIFDSWSGYSKVHQNDSSQSDNIDFLKQAQSLAQGYENSNDIERALAYYQQIRANSIKILQPLGEIKALNSQPLNQSKIYQLSTNAEEKMSALIRKYRLDELKKELDNENFGKRKENTAYYHFESRFTPGALKVTYKILMLTYGARGDLDHDGKLANPYEANQIPCDTLRDIEEAWRRATKNRCGWSGLNSNYKDYPTNCDNLNGFTLTTSVFNLPFEDAILDRLEFCRI